MIDCSSRLGVHVHVVFLCLCEVKNDMHKQLAVNMFRKVDLEDICRVYIFNLISMSHCQ